MINPFIFASTPHLHFGRGKISDLPSILKSYGSKVLLITGARSFITSLAGKNLLEQLALQHYSIEKYFVEKEPTPDVVDTAVKNYSVWRPDVVVAIGGGSALDAGKAIAAMLPLGEPVKPYLEGVGNRNHPGNKTPFIAVPTTAGTGSEATKNAVISETGDNGYKCSLRHNNFVPDVSLIDPELTISCPPSVTAASGMDAFTQLLESYLSTSANCLTDAWALEGLKLVSRSLIKAYNDGSDIKSRTDMALAAYLSGVTLANAGLGLVHGFASSVGGFFDIPHGVICSTLMPAANALTVQKLRSEKINSIGLKKYAEAGKIFFQVEGKSEDYYIDSFLEILQNYHQQLGVPRLGACGVLRTDHRKIADKTSNKNNPVKLEKEEILAVLERST